MDVDDSESSEVTYILAEVFVLPVYRTSLATIEGIEIPNSSQYTHFIPFFKSTDMKSANKIAMRLCGKGSVNKFVSLDKSKIKYTDWVYESGIATNDRKEYIVVIAVERMRQNMMFGSHSQAAESGPESTTPAQ
jgi:hypothetical protein